MEEASSLAATADFNRDGKPDVASLVSEIDASISVLISTGTGAGDFAQGTRTPIGVFWGADDLEAADLDMDGYTDLVVADAWSNALVLLFGDGSGGFPARVDYTPGCGPTSVTVGDLNGDLRPDLVLVCEGERTLVTLLGEQMRAFGTPAFYPTAASPRAVEVTKGGEDDYPDIIIAYESGVSLHRGQANGEWWSRVDYELKGDTLYALVSADFNGDGLPDLAVTYNELLSHTGVGVMLGTDTGDLTPVIKFPTSTRNTGCMGSVVAADLNADGKLDLVVACGSTDGEVSTLLGRGDGSFGPPAEYPTSVSASRVVVADFNGDTRPDLGIPVPNARAFRVLEQQPNGSYPTTLTGPSTDIDPNSLAAGDLNADGITDLVVATSNFRTVSVLIGLGNGTYAARQDYDAGSQPVSAVIADVNRDGKLDFLVAGRDYYDKSLGTITTYLGAGNGLFGPRQDSTGSPYPEAMAVGDVDGDNRLDVVVSSGLSRGTSLMLGNGNGTFGPVRRLATYGGPDVALADLNGDAQLDVIVADTQTKTVGVLLGRGDGMFADVASFDVQGEPLEFALADLTADNTMDLIVSLSSSEVRFLLGAPDATFALNGVYTGNILHRSFAIADFDGDGWMDVLTTNPYAGTVTLLHGHGNGTLTDGTDFWACSGARSPVLADFNDDGRMDVTMICASINSIQTLWGQCL